MHVFFLKFTSITILNLLLYMYLGITFRIVVYEHAYMYVSRICSPDLGLKSHSKDCRSQGSNSPLLSVKASSF